ICVFFFSSRRRHTRLQGDWSSDVCSSDLYVGAGSSGRMAVLDAAECQPTFGTPPKLVQALIAGGGRAITRAVEGAEDDVRRAEGELRTRKLTRNDVVVGVTASGTTPYVLAALR